MKKLIIKLLSVSFDKLLLVLEYFSEKLKGDIVFVFFCGENEIIKRTSVIFEISCAKKEKKTGKI